MRIEPMEPVPNLRFKKFLHPLVTEIAFSTQCKVIEIREAALTQDFDHSYCLPQNI